MKTRSLVRLTQRVIPFVEARRYLRPRLGDFFTLPPTETPSIMTHGFDMCLDVRLQTMRKMKNEESAYWQAFVPSCLHTPLKYPASSG